MRLLVRCAAYLLPWALFLLSAAVHAQDVVEYYHTDGIGNVRVVTDATGAVIERHDYLPFGEEWCGTAVCGANRTPGQPLRFTGKERDAETGLDYFGARYYRANAGRFTTVDPVYTWKETLLDPQRWNRYAYAKNNPLRYTDPDGRETAPQPGTLDWIIGQFNRTVGLNTVPNYILLDGQPKVAASVDEKTVKKAVAVIAVVGVVAAVSESGKSSDQTQGGPEPRKEITPATSKDAFEPVRGTAGRRNSETGEVWVKDRLHKDHYEVYKDKKAFEKGALRGIVWVNRRV